MRHVLGPVLTFLGILLTFVFWYEVIPLGPKFVEWGRDPENILMMFAVWALLGGFSCLFLSQHIANWSMGVSLAEPGEADAGLEQAATALAKAGQRLKLKTLPQLGVYESSELNAFMAGFALKNSTLAISRGALQTLSQDELEILISRELLHFKSGDLGTLAFMQGTLFAFTLYTARMLAFLLGTSLRNTEEEATSSDFVEVLLTLVLTVLLTLPGAMVFGWYSRVSASRADTATARLFGPAAYAALLSRLPGQQLPRREFFSEAFKWQSRPLPAALSWLTLQPDPRLRAKRLSI